MTEAELRELLEELADADVARLSARPDSPERVAAEAEVLRLARIVFATRIEREPVDVA